MPIVVKYDADADVIGQTAYSAGYNIAQTRRREIEEARSERYSSKQMEIAARKQQAQAAQEDKIAIIEKQAELDDERYKRSRGDALKDREDKQTWDEKQSDVRHDNQKSMEEIRSGLRNDNALAAFERRQDDIRQKERRERIGRGWKFSDKQNGDRKVLKTELGGLEKDTSISPQEKAGKVRDIQRKLKNMLPEKRPYDGQLNAAQEASMKKTQSCKVDGQWVGDDGDGVLSTRAQSAIQSYNREREGKEYERNKARDLVDAKSKAEANRIKALADQRKASSEDKKKEEGRYNLIKRTYKRSVNGFNSNLKSLKSKSDSAAGKIKSIDKKITSLNGKIWGVKTTGYGVVDEESANKYNSLNNELGKLQKERAELLEGRKQMAMQYKALKAEQASIDEQFREVEETYYGFKPKSAGRPIAGPMPDYSKGYGGGNGFRMQGVQ